jgi:hypothetical protein
MRRCVLCYLLLYVLSRLSKQKSGNFPGDFQQTSRNSTASCYRTHSNMYQRVDEHAKLKTKLKTKQSSQPQSTSPTCVSRVTWGPTQVSWIPDESHKGSYKGSHKESHEDNRSEGSHKHNGCNRRRSTIFRNLRSSRNFSIISEPNVLIWLR